MGAYGRLGVVAELPVAYEPEAAELMFDTIAEYKVSLEKFWQTTGMVGQTASELARWAERMFRLLEVQAEHASQANSRYVQAVESFEAARGEFAQLSPELMTPAEKESLGQVKVAYKNGEMMSGPELAEAIAADREAQRDALAEKTLNTMNTALRQVSGAVTDLQDGLDGAASSNDVLYGPPADSGAPRGPGDFSGGGGGGRGPGGGFGGSGGLPGVGVPGGPSMPGVPGGSGLRGGVLPGGP
ncbi:hypothetical protein, partial [Buchananella hordeovulneris]